MKRLRVFFAKKLATATIIGHFDGEKPLTKPKETCKFVAQKPTNPLIHLHSDIQNSIMRILTAVGQFALAASISLAPAFAQKKAPENWFNLDAKANGTLGVSTDEAYKLLQGRTSQTVIVAVIDDGVDYNHEDLRDVMWHNKGEIPDNNIDDDKNGYIDDVYGWNFIGGKTGDVEYDNLELARLYRELNPKYERMDPAAVPAAKKDEYNLYLKVREAYQEKAKEAAMNLMQTQVLSDFIEKVKVAGGGTFDKKTLKAFKASTPQDAQIQKFLLKMDVSSFEHDIKEQMTYLQEQTKYQINVAYDPRNLVGDNYANAQERAYGNNRVLGPNGDHGTHVAGIIAANRTNNIGMQGVANNVQIMALRIVPNGDERDKDVANAIIYAVDNGAKVINMSFGKSWSYNKAAVDSAVRYAATRDVLIVHAAGNDALDLEQNNNVPTPFYEGGGKADNFMTIGASSWKKGAYLTANFSNYGKQTVDVFSPGVDIYSTVKGGNKYDSYSGTSMASPVAAGVAALLRSYFPSLTAAQVREIMMQSSVKIAKPVRVPGDPKKTVMLSELCISGGVVNAANAVKLAIEKTK